MAQSPVLAVGHTGVTVSDIDRSIAFYRDVLGCEVGEKGRYGGTLFAAITGVPEAEIDIAFVRAPGGHQIELLAYARPEDRRRSTLRPCDPGAMHLMLRVRDIDSVAKAIAAGGFTTVGPIQTVPDGPFAGLRAIYARDPDGVVLELIQEPPGVSLGLS
jgi:catechol 2,3-dioxygenase-like lactoylglutathione lyase family enzyme